MFFSVSHKNLQTFFSFLLLSYAPQRRGDEDQKPIFFVEENRFLKCEKTTRAAALDPFPFARSAGSTGADLNGPPFSFAAASRQLKKLKRLPLSTRRP